MNSANTKFTFNLSGCQSKYLKLDRTWTCNLKRNFTLAEALQSNLPASIKKRLHTLRAGSSIPFISWRRSGIFVTIAIKEKASDKKKLEKQKLKREIASLDHDIASLMEKKRQLAVKLDRIG